MTIFSTSTSAFFERSRSGMTALRLQAEALQQQLGSGERLQRSSDDPVAASRLRNLARADRLTQIDTANAERAATDLTLTDSTLAAFASTLTRARELAVQAGSDTLTTDQRAAIGAELEQIHGHLVSLANARDSAGHSLFGGETAGDAYTIDGSGNAVYLGTGSASELSLGDGQSVTRGLTGPEFLNFDPGTGPTDTFAVIRDLALALGGASADPAQSARDALGALSGALDSVTTSQTVVGTRLAWIDFVTTRHEDLGELRATEEADLGGTDIASTVARLQEALVVLEASQASFAKLAGLSLFNSLN
ncbi:MAG: flagellar hook-associated protein FlgL [Novosphingobium sp.]|nr:flagellar hook-associated protein FlgL [Novosphingobium sp.]